MKRFLSILLATVVLFSLPACEVKALGESLKAEETYVDSMIGGMPSDEYDRAIWYGFVDKEFSRNKNRTVTWR